MRERAKKGALMGETTPDHVKGHRARLRERFLKGGADALADYELLELLLLLINL